MKEKNSRVCPASQSWMLDNALRRLVQPPGRIVGDFVKARSRVMDLGCGPGYFALYMADKVGPEGKIIAVDVQEAMLEKLRGKAVKRGLEERLDIRHCQAGELNFPDLEDSLDFILLYYMIHETPDPIRLLGELKTLLKKDGRMLIVDPVFHVRESVFRDMLHKARQMGYQVEGPSRKRGGWCAVLSIGDGAPI